MEGAWEENRRKGCHREMGDQRKGGLVTWQDERDHRGSACGLHWRPHDVRTKQGSSLTCRVDLKGNTDKSCTGRGQEGRVAICIVGQDVQQWNHRSQRWIHASRFTKRFPLTTPKASRWLLSCHEWHPRILRMGWILKDWGRRKKRVSVIVGYWACLVFVGTS